MTELFTHWVVPGLLIIFVIWLIRDNISTPVRQSEILDRSLPRPNMYDYKGVIHCHTKYSDGAVTFPELITIANELDIDYLITSDHNTLDPVRDGWEGWHNNTLILVGEEVSLKSGHLLVYNLGEKMPVKETQAAIDYANQRGALTFIAHPYNLKQPWTNWKAKSYTGLEVVNFDSLWRRKAVEIFGIVGLIRFLSSPQNISYLLRNNRPNSELKKWDKLAAQHKVVAMGGVDAHGYFKFNRKKYRIPSYSHIIQTVFTHILTPRMLSRNNIEDSALVYKSLANGHSYISFDILAPTQGFQFVAFNNSAIVVMGDSIKSSTENPVTLAVYLPGERQGIITLYRNGKAEANIAGNNLLYAAAKPGAYRVEVYLYQSRLPLGFIYRKQLWILSNHIHVS